MLLRHRFVVSLFAISLCLAGCSDGSGGGGGGAVSAPIGAAGGQVISADGRLTVTVPAGALATTEMISITPLASGQLDADVAALVPFAAYRLEPDGLQFAQPVMVELDGGAPSVNSSGVLATGLFALILQSAATRELLATDVVVDAVANTTMLCSTVDHFSDLLAFSSEDVDAIDGSISVIYPEVLAGGSGALIGEVSQPSNSTVSSGAISWSSSPTGGLASSIEQLVVFDSGGLSPLMQQDLTNTAVLTCLTPGLRIFSVEFRFQTFDIGGLLPGLVDPGSSPNIRFDSLETTCPPPGGGGIPTLLQVSGITSIEGIRLVSPPAGCGADPALLVAGTGGANLVDPLTGAIVQLLAPPGTDAFFDALYFPRPTGQPDNGLFLSGTTMRMQRLDDQCAGVGFVQTSLNGSLDATYADLDPMGGGHAAAPGVLIEIVFDTNSQGWVFQDSGIPLSELPQGFRSVQGEISGSRFLAVGDNGLFFIDDSGPALSSQMAFSLGQNPRRVRWDPVSQVGAVSDLDDDTVTIFTWDGVSTPVLTDVVTVGAGPVGVDILGNRVLSAGFFDATYTVIELDNNGMAVNTSISPSPFTTAGMNPGHAIFLGDANNTVVLSFNGDDRIGLIPDAF